MLLLYHLARDVKTLETQRSLVFDGIDIEANGKHCRLKVDDENIACLCNSVATAIPASTRPPKYNNRQRPRRPIPQQTAAVRAGPTNTRQPYMAAIEYPLAPCNKTWRTKWNQVRGIENYPTYRQ